MSLIWLGIYFSVLLTSMLSGVLGMGGGMLLMGVLALLLPTGTAMTLHGLAQLAANGSRALIHFKHVEWRILPFYALGALGAFLLFYTWHFFPENWLVYILMGCMPWFALYGKRFMVLNIEKPAHAVFCGFLVCLLQLASGVSGPALDIFYLHSRMSRHRIVASKAITQTLGHALKIFYYGPLMASAEFSQGQALTVALLALTGTLMGGKLLDHANDENFQHWSRRFILFIGSGYLLMGVREFFL